MSLQFVTSHFAGYLSLVHYLVCPWDRYSFRHVVIDISFRRSHAGNQTQLIFWGWTDQSRTKWVVPKNKLVAEFRCWKMPLLLLFALCSHSFQHRNSVRKFIWHILYVKRFLYWSLYWVPKGAVKSVTGPLSLFSGVHLIIWEARWWGFAPAEKKLLKYSFERRWLVELMWIPRGEVGWAYFSLLHREKSLALIHRLMPRKVVL